MLKPPTISSVPAAAEITPAPEVRHRRPRRGVTSMEYLVMLSFIIVVIIIVVQHLGGVTRGLFQTTANATTNQASP